MKKNNKKVNAAILIIGNEILSGRTQDTNSNYIAKKLLEAGIKLEEVIVIQDDKKTIIENVLTYSSRYSYVFTTGGIGPTHDDITSESISEAFNLQYETNKMAFEILENYYPKGEFNESRQRMAKMPFGSQLILNPMTAAPGFIVKNIYVLPGVPEIMQVMFEELLKKISVASDIDGLESRSEGDCPYGQNLSLRLFCLRHCGSSTIA